jgi:hypothetical protein
VPDNLRGRKVTIKATFDLGPLNPPGKLIESNTLEISL